MCERKEASTVEAEGVRARERESERETAVMF